MLSPATNRKGYKSVSLRRDGKARTQQVHALVLEAFVGPRPAGFVTRHLDGNPANNDLTNLRWGTHSENVRDSIAHGTHYSPARDRTHCPHGHEYDSARSNGRRECSKCRLAESRRRKRNLTKHRERQRKRYAEDGERIREYQKQYYEQNREKVRARQRAYYLRKKAEKAAQDGA
jgi:HNH endonuclease